MKKTDEKVKKVTTKKTTEKKTNGLMKPMLVSETLNKVIKKKECSRAESMKYVWEYITKNKLQDEKDRRKINPNDILGEVTGKKSFGMMQLAGKVFKHLSDKK